MYEVGIFFGILISKSLSFFLCYFCDVEVAWGKITVVGDGEQDQNLHCFTICDGWWTFRQNCKINVYEMSMLKLFCMFLRKP